MNSKKIFLLTSFILFSSCFIFGQKNKHSIPLDAMPTENNKVLINEIIEGLNYEQTFIEHCTNEVKSQAKKENWNKAKTRKILKSIDFETYRLAIHNRFAFFSTRQLENMVKLATDGIQDETLLTSLIFSNPKMLNKLDLYIENLIEGKYIVD